MTFNKERLRATFARDEGCNLKVHDVAGLPHIGYGRSLLTKGLTDAELEMLGVDDEDDITEITQAQADALLDNDLRDAEAWARDAVGETFDDMPALAQEVCINVAFNVGPAGIKKFRRMLAALKAGDYPKAAKELLDSRAAKQTGERYYRLARTLEHNDEVFLELGTAWDTGTAKQTAPLQGVEDLVRTANLKQYSNQELLNELLAREG